MDRDGILRKVKSELSLNRTHDLMVLDMVDAVCSYCNLPPADIPDGLEPFIRRKVKGIVDYEAVKGTGYSPDIASIREGDGSITYVMEGTGMTRAEVYGLNENDRRMLRMYRRVRGYD